MKTRGREEVEVTGRGHNWIVARGCTRGDEETTGQCF